MDIINEVNTYLLSKTTPYADIVQDVFTLDKKSIMSRHDPGPEKEVAYYDQEYASIQNMSYYAKSDDAQEAREQLDTFISLLDLKEVEITDGLFVSIEPTAKTSFVNRLETEEFVYTCSFKIDYVRSIS